MKVLKVKRFGFCFERKNNNNNKEVPWDYWFIVMTNPSPTNPKPLQHFGPTKTPKNCGRKLKIRCSKLRKRFSVRGKPRRCLILSERFLSLKATTAL